MARAVRCRVVWRRARGGVGSSSTGEGCSLVRRCESLLAETKVGTYGG